MKKFKLLWIIVAIVVAVGVALTVFFVVRNKKKNEQDFIGDMQYLSTEYEIGEKIYFNYVVYTDINIANVKYQLNVDMPVAIPGAKVGKTEDLEGVSTKKDYYADTKVIEIETDDMDAGWYNLTILGYDQAGTEYELTETPYLFKLVSAD